MRIWDIEPVRLCRNHLLGEHNELHAIWSIIIHGKNGYAHHPEVMRWRGRLKALYLRHEKLVKEFKRRGYRHQSILDKRYARGSSKQSQYVDSVYRQRLILKGKRCSCNI